MRRAVVVPIVVGLCALSLPALSYPRPGTTRLVSPGSNGHSLSADVSASGRFVAFVGDADDIVPGDDNRRADIFVTDLVEGITERVSVGMSGGDSNADSDSPSISADGRFVAFSSDATNLVPGDTNMWQDVFVRDLQTDVTERVSISSEGLQGTRESNAPDISGDGRYVAFASRAPNLVPNDDNGEGVLDVFVRDRVGGAIELVSVSSNETSANGIVSGWPSIDHDGRYIAFESAAPNLVDDDRNRVVDIFLRDRVQGTTQRISSPGGIVEANGASSTPAVSADGRYVAFASLASNLVPRDGNGLRDVFVKDVLRDRIERVSVSSSGVQQSLGLGGDGLPTLSPDWVMRPAISAEGRYVAFVSGASNLVAGDADAIADVFVHDRVARTTERVSVAGTGPAGERSAAAPGISSDGTVVTFEDGDALSSDDTDEMFDIYARRRGGSIGLDELQATTAPGGTVRISGSATFSGAPAAGGSDPPDDGAPGARELGADLVGAGIVYRPEQEDLLARIELSALPATRPYVPGQPVEPGQLGFLAPSEAGSPVLHGLSFVLDAMRYEVRAIRVNVEETPTEPLVSLWRCPSSCNEIAHLSAAYGTTGDEIIASIPLKIGTTFRADEGDALATLSAYSAVGEPLAGPLRTLDEMTMPPGSIPARAVAVGLAPAGTPAEDVAFKILGPSSAGRFTGSVPSAGLAPGPYDAWGRACFGGLCSYARTSITL